MVGLTHGERIAHCEHIKLVTEKAFPIQIDGGECAGREGGREGGNGSLFTCTQLYTEAWKLQPSVIEVGLKNRANMVRKVPRIHPDAPLQG